MSAAAPATDSGVERDVDLRRLFDAIVSRWWLLVAGVVAGAVLGALAATSRGTTYSASVLLAPGQAFSPSGAPVLTYLTSLHGVQTLVDSPAVLQEAAKKAGLDPAQLQGHVNVAFPTNDTGATTSTRLIQITVDNAKPKHAEAAANALGTIVRRQTVSPYVLQSIAIYKTRLANYKARLKTLQSRIASLNETLKQEGDKLAPLDRLVLVSQLDQTQAFEGALFDQQTQAQQQLTLAQEIELTQQISGNAVAVKSTLHSARNSIVVGAVIGLLIAAIVAVVLDVRGRAAKKQPVTA